MAWLTNILSESLCKRAFASIKVSQYLQITDIVIKKGEFYL